MISVGIDVAKNKHDCTILDGQTKETLCAFTIQNDREGFQTLLERVTSFAKPQEEIRVGLEATGHYSYNILGFLFENGLTTYPLNPMHTNFYRKSLTLRKTKTDRVDARIIAMMLLSDVDLKPYTGSVYYNENLKSLTRYRFAKVRECAKLKQSVSRLVCILFPELEKQVSTLHGAAIYEMLLEFPGAKQIASANLTHLKSLLYTASKGHFGREMAIQIRDAARDSIGSHMPAKSLELQHTIRLIRELEAEIKDIEDTIQAEMDLRPSPITSIPGLSSCTAAAIISEVGDFSQFSSPDKILAFAGLSPSRDESGQRKNGHAHMEKRGSRYLRYALFDAAKHVCLWGPTYAQYLAKKRAEGKHYFVAISHAAKKLVRLIFALQKSGQAYRLAA